MISLNFSCRWKREEGRGGGRARGRMYLKNGIFEFVLEV